MILNRASYQRGFAHATVYKCEVRGVVMCGCGHVWVGIGTEINFVRMYIRLHVL